jgi:hypothetical protein
MLIDDHHLSSGSSNEQFPVLSSATLNPSAPDICFDNMAFSIERAALPLFGFPNYGSMLIGTKNFSYEGRGLILV